jgi:ABC-type multidrug transport system fused ATPase/permease subunit
MESNVYRFIFRHSWRQQIFLVVATALAFPFLYMSFDLPKTIINEAIGGTDFPKAILGVEFDQIPYLVALTAALFALVLVNGGFKYTINVYKGRLGERMLRRLRYELYSRVLRFPLPHFKRVSQGEVIPMITAEVEPLGGFVGDSVAQPLFQGGTLLTILAFMFVQDWVLGLAAIALYPFQAYLIPKLQRQVNQLAKRRVQAVRRLSERIGESISGVTEIRAHDASALKRAEFADQLGTIYDVRYDIFRRKFFIKFLNNFLAQLTPLLFYSIGGYLVIQGDLSIGALVAVLAAHKDMSGPWKELLAYYQQKEDSLIKYSQVVEQFDPEGILDEALQTDEPETPFAFKGSLIAANLSYAEDESKTAVDSVSFTIGLDETVAIVGPSGGGKEELGLLLARLLKPTGGRITVADHDLSTLPEAVTGRHMAYVGRNAYLFSASVRDNLFLGLRHRPLKPADYDAAGERRRADQRQEAAAAGNSEYDINAEWVDYDAAGTSGPADLNRRAVDVLDFVDMDDDIYELGLRGTVDPARQPALAEQALVARSALRERLVAAGWSDLVEPFDSERYNRNATLAENLLFGRPVGDRFNIDSLANHPYVLEVLDKAGLTEDLLSMGHQVAEVMVELFSDLAPGHDFFEQYGFIDHDDLPEYQALIGRVSRGNLDALKDEERQRLLSLPFKLIPDRHRLGIIDEEMEERLLAARRLFAGEIPDALRSAIEFFDPELYNAAASLQDNILFGKIAYGQAQGPARVGQLIREVIDELGLRETITEAGLDYDVGIGGSRLSSSQRQKVATARCLVRRPDLFIINEATAGIESSVRARIMESVLKEFEGRGLIWILESASLARDFDRTIVIRGGKIVEDGRYADLDRPGTLLREMVAAE